MKRIITTPQKHKIQEYFSSILFQKYSVSQLTLSFTLLIGMAASRQCSACKKEPGPIHCTGCDRYFCRKDFKTHTEEMFGEMDKIIEERNRLQDEITNRVQPNDQQHPLMKQIDAWQTSTIEKVKRVAAQARKQAEQLLNAKNMKMKTEFKSFSEELARLKESENYVEHDLERLNHMITQFKQDLRQSTQPTTIVLHTEQSDAVNWESLIYVEEKRVIGKRIYHFSLVNILVRNLFNDGITTRLITSIVFTQKFRLKEVQTII